MSAQRAPASAFASTAILSPCGEYRYYLTRDWVEPGKTYQGPVTFIMLNPSTADADVDDPTIRRCIRFAKDWGFSGLRVANLYALRATHPSQLWRHDEPIGPDNERILRGIAETEHLVVLAWGCNPDAKDAAYVRDIFSRKGVRQMCLGLTKNGQPKHPLYLRADTPWIELPATCAYEETPA